MNRIYSGQSTNKNDKLSRFFETNAKLKRINFKGREPSFKITDVKGVTPETVKGKTPEKTTKSFQTFV